MARQITLKDIRKMLKDGLEWPPELRTNASYTRLHDDHDGTNQGTISVLFSLNGDAWAIIDQSPGKALRFRSGLGGGRSPRVRNALMLLALAIKWDNEESPAD